MVVAGTVGTRRSERRFTRRRLLAWGLGATATVVGAGAAGDELVSHGVLPGRQLLLHSRGTVPWPCPRRCSRVSGRAVSGTFYSQARRRTVGYTIAYPPGHGTGQRPPSRRHAPRLRGQSHERVGRHVARRRPSPST
jgi:hypothetical protein